MQIENTKKVMKEKGLLNAGPWNNSSDRILLKNKILQKLYDFSTYFMTKSSRTKSNRSWAYHPLINLQWLQTEHRTSICIAIKIWEILRKKLGHLKWSALTQKCSILCICIFACKWINNCDKIYIVKQLSSVFLYFIVCTCWVYQYYFIFSRSW